MKTKLEPSQLPANFKRIIKLAGPGASVRCEQRKASVASLRKKLRLS